MIQILGTKNDQFYYVVVAKNGRILVTSETFTRKANAIGGAKSLVGLLNQDTEIVDMTAA